MVVFHAGTAKLSEDIVSSGGRVIAVTAHATTLQEALDLVYKGVDQVHFEGKTYRRDIAHRCVMKILYHLLSLRSFQCFICGQTAVSRFDICSSRCIRG